MVHIKLPIPIQSIILGGFWTELSFMCVLSFTFLCPHELAKSLCGGGGWVGGWVCKPILVFRFGPNLALGLHPIP